MEQKNNSNLTIIRHSLAHVMALAILRLYKKVFFGIGPTIENGFYYDIQVENKQLNEDDLSKIEEEMKRIIKEGLPFRKKIVSLTEAKKVFKILGQKYKIELLIDLEKYGTTDFEEIKKEKKMKKIKNVSLYQVGEFTDLCRGPQVKNTKELPFAFKLVRLSGAYWRGSEKNAMLQRIVGVAFLIPKDLKNYLYQIEEAEKRDHRQLGKDLDLFSQPEELGGGLPLWHPAGALMRKIIEDFWKEEHRQRGYQLVYTPHIAKLDIWKKSGHWDFYRENMYSPIKIDEEEYIIKPMNCPFHIFIYQSQIRSYKDLPIRLAELGTVYRYERSGVLHGLTRVRGFTQDDAHIFCQPKQLEEEIIGVLNLAKFMLKSFGFKDYEIFLSTRPQKFAGTIKNWEKATKALETALKKTKTNYQIDPGEGVFYGPKIDIKLKDSLGRFWQGPTIQVDFNFPQRFSVNYINKKGKQEEVVMIHRTVLGSMERFMGCLIEHYGGAFPLWFSPLQVVILPVGKIHHKYAQKINQELLINNLRSGVWAQNETISKKIRQAEMQKIPYILVVGDKEKAQQTVAVRKRGQGDLGPQKFSEFIIKLIKEVENKK